jgi:hypothetical protein
MSSGTRSRASRLQGYHRSVRQRFRVARAFALAFVLVPTVGGSPSPARGPSAAPAIAALANSLRALYASPGEPGERWRRRPAEVVLDDGTRVPREAAYRDHPAFVPAAARLLQSTQGDDALLGAWLLGTAADASREPAAAALAGALGHSDPRVRFEAARALGVVGASPAVPSLRALVSGGQPPERGAAVWAMQRIAERGQESPPSVSPGDRASLAAGFCRGVNWWFEEDRGDAGAASFAKLRRLGVDWVSIHTWDPLQRSVHSPEWAEPRRPLAIPSLKELVRNAHAEGLKVMVKPHLEMRGYEPTPAEMRVLRGPDEAARKELLKRLRAEWAGKPRVWHNDIEMKSEADWREWFSRYEAYVLGYVRQATEAGADAFCVGRETDKAAVQREADWRRLIGRVREGFKGPLTYSANFDSYARIPFWDALDVIGVSAYFPLADGKAPSAEHLAVAWEEIMAPLEAFARRQNRRVVFTEIGYPAVSSAARRPWDDASGPADVGLQAWLYEAALQAIASRPFMAGTFFWLWEGVARPPFRDASFSIQDKPASFVMARWYAAPPPPP